MKLIDKFALVAEIKEIKNTEYNGNSIGDDVACCALDMVIDAIDTLEIKYLQEEPETKFKVGDKIKVKPFPEGQIGIILDVWPRKIIDITGGYYILDDNHACEIKCQDNWELVEEPKEFKPVRKKQPEGVLKELLDNMDEKELEETRKEMMQEEPVSIDFEQELYKAFGQVKDFTLGMQIAKRFYNIGKNSQEPVSEEQLDTAAREWICDHKEGERLFVKDAFIAGVKWILEQQKNKNYGKQVENKK